MDNVPIGAVVCSLRPANKSTMEEQEQKQFQFNIGKSGKKSTSTKMVAIITVADVNIKIAELPQTTSVKY